MAVFDRRKFLRRAGLSAAAVATAPAALTALAPAAGAQGSPLHCGGLQDAGAGIYTDASVMGMLSSFSITRQLVTCGVGLPTGMEIVPSPFGMLMYSTHVRTYRIDPHHHMITAIGRMRSITMVAGHYEEDIEHDFWAFAVDNPGEEPDRFDVHMITPYWATSPMRPPSDFREGWARFGGALVVDEHGHQMGDVAIGDPHAHAPDH